MYTSVYVVIIFMEPRRYMLKKTSEGTMYSSAFTHKYLKMAARGGNSFMGVRM